RGRRRRSRLRSRGGIRGVERRPQQRPRRHARSRAAVRRRIARRFETRRRLHDLGAVPAAGRAGEDLGMIRLLLADDHTVLRECLVTALRTSGDCIVVAEAGDGISAIEQAHAVKPDVAIVDISMPRLNGIEVVRRLTTELPRTRVLVLTMHEEEEYVLQV